MILRLQGWVLLLALVWVLPCQSYAQSIEPSAAEPMTLSDLVRSVRDSAAAAQVRLKEREDRFIAARDQRQEMLQAVRSQRRAAESEADQLRAAFQAAEEQLADLETQLEKNAGDLGEVFSVVRQVAGDVTPVLQNSLVSAQLGERVELVERLSTGEVNPSAEDLRSCG